MTRTARLVLGIVAGWVAPLCAQDDGGTVPPESPATRLARADSAFAAEVWDVADSAYAAVLADDPWNSRATYRLALLRRRRDPGSAAALFERYVELEPTDPWGYMAVGDVNSRLARHRSALEWYDRALALAPTERDAVIGKARVLGRARDTDAAIDIYEEWVVSHPSDAEALRELSRELQRAGRYREAIEAYRGTLAGEDAEDGRLRYLRSMVDPAFAPTLGRSVDSDGIGRWRLGAAADVMVGERSRAGIAFLRTAASDDVSANAINDVRILGQWRPSAPWRIEGALGFASASVPEAAGVPGPPAGPRAPGATGGGASYLTWRARLRYRRPVSGPDVDVRVSRAPLDASPLLVANHIAAHDLRTTVAVPVRSRVRVRALGRLTAITGGAETNWRRGLAAVLAYGLSDLAEVSVQVHNTWYASPSTDGYFAPRFAKSVEVGSYAEFYPPWATLVAFDAGVGLQRTAQHDLSATGWHPTFRLWGQLTAPLAARVALNVELEAYDARIGDVITSTSASWRYLSLTAGLRVGL